MRSAGYLAIIGLALGCESEKVALDTQDAGPPPGPPPAEALTGPTVCRSSGGHVFTATLDANDRLVYYVLGDDEPPRYARTLRRNDRGQIIEDQQDQDGEAVWLERTTWQGDRKIEEQITYYRVPDAPPLVTHYEYEGDRLVRKIEDSLISTYFYEGDRLVRRLRDGSLRGDYEFVRVFAFTIPDGEPDDETIYTYPEPGVTQVTIDQDLDGAIDASWIERYEDGELTELRGDGDGDGQIDTDTRWTYEGGLLVRQERTTPLPWYEAMTYDADGLTRTYTTAPEPDTVREDRVDCTPRRPPHIDLDDLRP